MKKVLALILALATMAVLFGCGAGSPQETPTDTGVITEPMTEPSTEGSTEPVTEPATQVPTEPVTEPATQTPTSPATKPSTQIPADSVRRISSVSKLSETFYFSYEDSKSPQVTFLLRGNPHLISTFYPSGQVKTEEKYTASNKLYHLLEYNEQGQLISESFPETDDDNHTLQYTYTPEGLPKTVTASAPNHSSQVVQRWRYDDQGRILEQVDKLDQFRHELDPYGYDPVNRRETWKYDEKGQTVEYCRYSGGALVVRQKLSYDSQGNITQDLQTYTSGLERQILNLYSDQGLLVRSSKQETQNGQTITYLSEYHYNDQGQKLSCTHKWSTGEVYEDSWAYDSNGVLIEENVYEFSRTVRKFCCRYNSMGQMTERNIIDYDEAGEIYNTYLHLWHYDQRGNLVKKEYYENENWVNEETYEYEQDRLVCHTWKDRYNAPGFQRRHYDEAGNLIDVSTGTLASLTAGTDTLVTAEFLDRTHFYAVTYEEAKVAHSDTAVWEKIEDYIIEQMKKRDQ